MNKIICADVIDGLVQIPDDSVTLVITSPPYNLKIDYASATDDQPYKDYLKWLKEVFTECKRVLRKGGRLIINIDAMTNRQEDKQDEYVRPIYVDLGVMMREIGMKFFGEHIWYKSGACPCKGGGSWNGKKTAWGSYCMPSCPSVRRNHEYVLIYSKENFKLEKADDSGEPDIEADEFQKWISSVWAINAETRNLGDHPVPFPLELPIRCCKLYSYPNDVILDPFCGVGTTLVAAKLLKRRYLGIDMEPQYCQYAKNRLEDNSDMFDD